MARLSTTASWLRPKPRDKGTRRPVQLATGAEGYAIRPPAEDALMQLLGKTSVLYFDMQRKVLIFCGLSFG